MREFIDAIQINEAALMELAERHIPLDQVNASVVYDAIKRTTHPDYGKTWMVHLVDRNDLDKIESRLQEYVDAAVAPLREVAAQSSIELMRGLTSIPYSGRPPRSGRLRRPIGIHWTQAAATIRQFGGAFVLHTTVTPVQVNWLGTVIRRMHWSREYEITLLPKTRITVRLNRGEETLGTYIGKT